MNPSNSIEYDSKFKASSLQSMLESIYANYGPMFEKLKEKEGEELLETVYMIMNFLDIHFNVRIKVHSDTIQQILDLSAGAKCKEAKISKHTVHLLDQEPSDVKFIIELQGLSFFYNMHEVGCAFTVTKKSFRAFSALNYGLRLFQNIRQEICKQLKIKDSRKLSPVEPSWANLGFDLLRKHIVCHSILRKKPEDVDVCTEEFGVLSSPSVDDMEQFVLHHLSHAYIPCPTKFVLKKEVKK